MTDVLGNEPLKVVFAGTPQVAIPTLQALYDSPHALVGVVTREPKRQGRRRALVDSEVAAWAKKHSVPVIETDRPSVEELSSVEQADVGVVVAYGALLSKDVLDIPRHGWLNLHFSALPDLRGAAPVQRAIWRGDQTFGSTVFSLNEGMDTGPIASVETYQVGEDPTSGEALEQLAVFGADQVLEVLDGLSRGQARFTSQEDLVEEGAEVSYAPRIDRKDAFVDFSGTANEVANQVRACSPNPGPWTSLPDGLNMKLGVVTPQDVESPGVGVVWVAQDKVMVGTLERSVALSTVAPAGKKMMDAAAWWRGARLDEGAVLGAPRRERE